MASIRKTKKRLKREIAEDKELLDKVCVGFPSIKDILLYDAIYQSVKFKEQELSNLKRRRNEEPKDQIKNDPR